MGKLKHPAEEKNVHFSRSEEGLGYCHIAKKTDDTGLIYYKDLSGMLDYVDKTIKK